MANPAQGSPLIPLPFEEAIAWAKGRGVVLPDVYYGELQGLARAMAFSVAGLASIDQLQMVIDSLAKATENGESLQSWQKRVEAWEIPLDLPAHRLDNLFRTNLQGHYARGRCQQHKENLDTHPWFLYDAVNDSRTRPAHAAMDGFVARHDDPVWKKWAAPNGYRCRCRLIALSEAQAARFRTADQRRQADPAIAQARMDALGNGPDAGWDYSVCEEPTEGVRRAVESRDGPLYKPDTQPEYRLRTKIKAAKTTEEKLRLALDMLARKSSRVPKATKFHGMGQTEYHVSALWEGLSLSYSPVGFGRDAVAELIVALVDTPIPRRLLKHNPKVVFSQQSNAYDAYWEKEYGIPGFVSRATGGDGMTVVYNMPLPAKSLAHESAHSLATAKYGSPVPTPGSDFARAVASGEPAPTTYSEGRIAEDFADSVALYIVDRARLKKTAPNRYRVVKRIIEDDTYDG